LRALCNLLRAASFFCVRQVFFLVLPPCRSRDCLHESSEGAEADGPSTTAPGGMLDRMKIRPPGETRKPSRHPAPGIGAVNACMGFRCSAPSSMLARTPSQGLHHDLHRVSRETVVSDLRRQNCFGHERPRPEYCPNFYGSSSRSVRRAARGPEWRSSSFAVPSWL
jgi:hypothetical protein